MMTRYLAIGLFAGIGIAISVLVAINTIPDMIKYTDSELVFESPINISNSTADSVSSEIATSRNNVFIVWDDGIETDDYEIFFRASYDYGSTFRDTINLSNTTGESIEPDIAISGRNIYVVWEEGELSQHEVYFSRSVDRGKSFEPPVNLSNNTGGSSSPSVVASGSGVYVGWSDDTLGNYDTFLRRSTDNGKSFEPAINLSNNSGNSEPPRIVTSGETVYVVWTDDSLGNSQTFLSKSDDGLKFSHPVNISNSPDHTNKLPNIVADSNNLYVVWYEENDLSNVFFRKSNDKGNNFEPTIKLTDSEVAYDPQLHSSGNNVYVIWNDSTEGNIGMFFRKSTNSGSSFDDQILISNDTDSSYSQRMIATSDSAYVVWGGHEPAESFITKEMMEGGFEPPVSLRMIPYHCCIEYVQLSIAWGHVYVIWHEIESSDSEGVKNDEIFFRSTPLSIADKFLAPLLEHLTI